MQGLRELHSARPRHELRGYVRAYAQREVFCPTVDFVQPVPASLEQILEFEFKDLPIIDYYDACSEKTFQIAIVGAHTFPPASIRLRGSVESFAIFFQPLAFSHLFHVPMGELLDKSFDSLDVLGNQIRQLWLRMAESKSFLGRVAVAEEYLLKKAESISECSSIMRSALHIFEQRGMVRVDRVACGAALSVRQFERRFLDEIGVAPKLFARITRFQMALDAKIISPGCSWLTIAHQFGYFDQMHMIRDFQDLSRSSPTRLLTQLGDTRPPALASS